VPNRNNLLKKYNLADPYPDVQKLNKSRKFHGTAQDYLNGTP
jgi:hypothetical protein